jgi:hypothetical protein
MMECQPTFWGEESLEAGPISLFLATKAAGDGCPPDIAFGGVSDGDKNVLIARERLAVFLQKHAEATLICYDAASLHWSIHAYLEQHGEQEDVGLLWKYSEEFRLVDIMLLDQHVRRIQGDNDVAATSLEKLVQRCAGVELPNQAKIGEQVVVAQKELAKGKAADGSKFGFLTVIATGVLRTYERLLVEITAIENAVDASQLPSVTMPPMDPTVVAKLEAQGDVLIKKILSKRGTAAGSTNPPADLGNAAIEKLGSFDVMGIGIEVQAAIALNRPDQEGLHVYRQGLRDLCARNCERYQRASEILYRDGDTRACFEWSDSDSNGMVVKRSEDGLPMYKAKYLKTWLRNLGESFRDIHNLPAKIPCKHDGAPSFDPERWGIWSACNLKLRAWRDLQRSAHLALHLDGATRLRPVYSVVPVLKSRAPDLLALRSLGLPVFCPREGRVFVVGELPLLKVICFAAIHQDGSHTPRGRLIGHFLRTKEPREQIAGELWAFATRQYRPSTVVDDEEAISAHPRPNLDESLERFAETKESDPDVFFRWIEVAVRLLETVPLGLPEEYLRSLLEIEHPWNDMCGVDLHELAAVWLRQVIPEIGEFLDDDVHRRLARILRLTPGEGVDLLAEREFINTTDAALRNDLHRRRKGSPLWQFIGEVRRKQLKPQLPSDGEIVDLVLMRRVRTPAGRVIGPAFCAEVRRQQLELLADEVMKPVAYSLTANAFRVVAVVDGQFVVELPVLEATDDTLRQICCLARDASHTILAPLSVGCACERADFW